MTANAPAAARDQAIAYRPAAGFHRCFCGPEAGDGLFAGETFSGLLPPRRGFQVQGPAARSPPGCGRP